MSEDGDRLDDDRLDDDRQNNAGLHQYIDIGIPEQTEIRGSEQSDNGVYGVR